MSKNFFKYLSHHYYQGILQKPIPPLSPITKVIAPLTLAKMTADYFRLVHWFSSSELKRTQLLETEETAPKGMGHKHDNAAVLPLWQ